MRSVRDALMVVLVLYGLLYLMEAVLVEMEVEPMRREQVHPRRM